VALATASVRQWHLLLHLHGGGTCHSTTVAIATASVRQWHLSLAQYRSGNCHCGCFRTAVALATVRQWQLLLHQYGSGGAQVHLKETRADEPRVIYENLHFAFARMDDAKCQFSAEEKAHVANSPFMQLMVDISVALPAVKIVVQFSSGVEIHVDYRHLHRTAEMVSPSNSSFSSHAAGSFRLSMQHARADSARRALPQGELQATVCGQSVAGYVITEQVICGQTAMATPKNTGAKFGPLKDYKENVLLLVPRQPGDVLFVTSNTLAGLVTYPHRAPPSHDESASFPPALLLLCIRCAFPPVPLLSPSASASGITVPSLCAASAARTVRSASGSVLTATVRSCTRATPSLVPSSAPPSEKAMAMLPPR
jgi:hypothetical protein